MKFALSLAFLLTIPAANWTIGHIGTTCLSPTGPCLVAVLPGVLAPSGSLLIGLSLVLRNALQLLSTRRWILGCIAIGALLSAVVAPASLALASAAAFTLGECSDWAVFTPLRKRQLPAAILLAGWTGAVVDAFVFITIAFGAAYELMPGQIMAKIYASVLAAAVVWACQHRQPRRSMVSDYLR